MADKKLESITFPDLPDRYVVKPDIADVTGLQTALDGKASKTDVYNGFVSENIQGSIASFDDGADDIPVKSLVAEIVPLQSGSGDPSPDNVRAISGWNSVDVNVSGINVWDEEWELGIYNTSTGEKSINNNCIRSKNMIPVKNGETYTIIGGYSNSCCYDESGDFISTTPYRATGEYGMHYLDIPNNAYYITFYMPQSYGTTYNNDISINYPSTDHDYHAYSGEVHTISFASAGTVYGGRLDVTSGVLTVDKIGVDLGSLDWQRSTQYNNPVFYALIDGIEYPTTSSGIIPAMCEKYKQVSPSASNVAGTNNVFTIGYYYKNDKNINIIDTAYSDAVAFKTACSGVKLVCKLITPQTYQLTPTEVKSLLKNNNIWADTGDVTVEYVADTKTFIENLVNA